MRSISKAVQRRLRTYRARFAAATQDEHLSVQPGKLIVTTFYDVEGDYAIEGKHKPCFSALAKIAEVENQTGIRSTYNVVAKLAAEAPDLFRDLETAGHEIASHSLDHRVLTTISRQERHESIYRARDTFEQLGLKVVGHRSPQSSWSYSVINELIAAGYEWNAENDQNATPYVISRNRRTAKNLWRMPVAMDDWWYEGAGLSSTEVLKRWQDRVMSAKARGGYMAVGFHPWVEDPGERFVTFSEFMHWLADQSEIQLMPFRDVVAKVHRQ